MDNEWGNVRIRNSQLETVEKYVKVQFKSFPNKEEFRTVPNFVSHVLNKEMKV